MLQVVFSRLTTLKVGAYHEIKFLLSSSVARSLDRSLSTLEIRNCGSMEEIVSVQEDDVENNMDIIFSKLKSLLSFRQKGAQLISYNSNFSLFYVC